MRSSTVIWIGEILETRTYRLESGYNTGQKAMIVELKNLRENAGKCEQLAFFFHGFVSGKNG